MLRWLPENISTYGQGVDSLFSLIYWITVVAFVAVIGTLIVFLIKYRFQEGRRAEYIEGSNTLEITWTAVTTVIVFGLAMLSLPQWSKIKFFSEFPDPDVTVQVTAKQFNWDMLYPGPDGEFGGEDDLELENMLHVPVNKVVHIRMTSEDAIHSFFVPQLRLKQDVLPNRFITVWFEATKDYTSRFDIDSRFQSDLDNDTISDDFRMAFNSKGLGKLSDNVTVSIEETGNRWLITDDVLQRKHIVRKEDGRLNIYSNVYEIPCAELCGFGHSGMLGYLTVHSEVSYADWVKQRWPQQ
jgi:cytochrome c oxidase subunit 2